MPVLSRLHVHTDFLLFEEHEHGPGDDLALQLEAISPEDGILEGERLRDKKSPHVMRA
ncbi:hypothetical protein [Vibrio sp. J1-1]|uniref:hypothetical protein n=1 Tax=Vibrio sp. J1-1 TaxID=2912251 RepID=UPI001F377E08|nr:hypothetical protein [Vibrio sp. J1-1]